MPLPIENLDNKTYDDFFKEALNRIPQYAPAWTDHNVHDPGIMLIELFSWLAEMQVYSLNRITDAHRKKFLKLMGIPYPGSPVPARVQVTFAFAGKKKTPEYLTIPGGTRIYAQDAGAGLRIPFETLETCYVVKAALKNIFSYNPANAPGTEFSDHMETNQSSNIYFYAFGDKPRDGDLLYLGFEEAVPGIEFNIGFFLKTDENQLPGNEIGYKKPDVFPSAELTWEFHNGKDWQELIPGRDETCHLKQTGIIRFTLPQSIQPVPVNEVEAFWIRAKVAKAGYEFPPRIDKILLNTVTAFQVKTISVSYPANGLPGLSIELENRPVLKVNQIQEKYSELKDWKTPLVSVMNEKGAWETGISVEDFDTSRPVDNHYVLEPEKGLLSFGDGIHGSFPPASSRENTVNITYKSCLGKAGNVKARAVNTIDDLGAGQLTVYNHYPAKGGEDCPSLEGAVLLARRKMKQYYRAVTANDYEQIVCNTPGLGVARAKALPNYHPVGGNAVPGILSVIVIPQFQSPERRLNEAFFMTFEDNLDEHSEYKLSEGYIRTIYNHLEKFRLLTTEVFVLPPCFIKITVKAKIVVKKEALAAATIERVQAALTQFLDPFTGGRNGKGWEFGRPVYLSGIYHLIDQVQGVDYITDLLLYKNGQPQENSSKEAVDAVIPGHAVVYTITSENKIEYEV